jgi:hypothetical protein
MIRARRGGSVVPVLAARNANLAVRFELEAGLLAVVAVATSRTGGPVRRGRARAGGRRSGPGAPRARHSRAAAGAARRPVRRLASGVARRRLGIRALTPSWPAALAVADAVLVAVWNQ